MKWFKHYTDATLGTTMQALINEQNYAAIVVYFALLELVGRKGKDGEVTASIKLSARQVNMKSGRWLNLVGSAIQHGANLVLTKSGDNFNLKVLNWSELQENRGGKREIFAEQKTTEESRRESRVEEKLDKKRVNTVRSTKQPLPDAVASAVPQVRDAFLESYRKEFGRDYSGWGAKENAQAKMWLRSISLEKARELCQIFPKWNDPFVTRIGHPFGVLVKQYIQLDAWANGSQKLIKKIALGTAIETVDIKRAIATEEFNHGVQFSRPGRPSAADAYCGTDSNVSGSISNSPAPKLLGRNRENHEPEVHEGTGFGDYDEGGFDPN